MKKRNKFIFIFLGLTLLLSMPFASAGFFSDLFNKFFGKRVQLSPGDDGYGCFDPDGPDGIYGKTTVTDSGGNTGTDYCINSGTRGKLTSYVYEQYCDYGTIEQKKIQCPYGCVDGACKYAKSATLKLQTVINDTSSFTSSTIEFIDINTLKTEKAIITSDGLGTIIVLARSYVINYRDNRNVAEDEAVFIQGRTLYKGDVITFPICTDTDGGLNYFVLGAVTPANTTSYYIDACQNSDLLKEGSCTIFTENKLCSSLGNYVCQNGVCISPPPQPDSVTLQLKTVMNDTSSFTSSTIEFIHLNTLNTITRATVTADGIGTINVLGISYPISYRDDRNVANDEYVKIAGKTLYKGDTIILPPPQPDLSISHINSSEYYLPIGNSTTKRVLISATIKNIGGGDAGAFNIFIQGLNLTRDSNYGGLTAGNQVTVTDDYTCSSPHFYNVTLDRFNAVSETNENNNKASLFIDCIF